MYEHLLSDNKERKGVLICCGGRFEYNGIEQDASKTIPWLHARGFDVWVLDYSLAVSGSPIYPKPMDEARTAVYDIRKTNRVDRLGVWGWSAGGLIAAITSTTPEIRLDFMILSYPVISMKDDITHIPSRKNLLGGSPSPELILQISAESRVSETTPPTFIFHTAEDEQVPVENSLLFARKMNQHDRPFRIYVQPQGRHGIGMDQGWVTHLGQWLSEIEPDRSLVVKKLKANQLKLEAGSLSVKNYDVHG